MANNEGTVTIPIDRYLELTQFVDKVLKGKLEVIYHSNRHEYYTSIEPNNFVDIVTEYNKEFQRHNSALQKRIADFNKKTWYQRVFKSKV